MIRFIKKTTLLAVLASLGISWLGCYGQPTGLVENKKFDKRLSFLLDKSEVPFLGVEELKKNSNRYIILDARTEQEYEISHIPGAIWIGEGNYNKQQFSGYDHSKAVVVYCSVGYRSQLAGEELQSFGFSKVYNLYGSIFEWANRSYPLVDTSGERTNDLHTYNKNWSKWVFNEEINKIH